MSRLFGKAFAAIFVMLLVATRFMHAAPASPPVAAVAEAGQAAQGPKGYDPWSDGAEPPTALSGARVQHEVADTRIDRDASGQFHLSGRVNGRDTRFLVDTGADLVALGEAEAAQLGITITPDRFRPIMRTASGTGMAALVRIDRLEVAGRELHDVPAVVMQGLSVNLLGQSALKQLGKVELAGDRMVIKPV